MFFFSIVIPTYNRAEQLKKTLSLLDNQKYKNFEVIVVEDVVNNNTTINSFNNKLALKHLFIPYKKNVSAKRNLGANVALGEYIIFLDDDDFVNEKWLLDYSNELAESKADIAFCAVAKVKYDGNIETILPSKAYKDERDWGIFLAGAFAVKKIIFNSVNGYDEVLRYGENTELGLRLKQAITSVRFIETINLTYKASANGGSKNLENTFIANNHILVKHKEWFSNHPNIHFNYLSVLGVVCYKLKKNELSKKYFKQALLLKSNVPKAWLRYTISRFPFLASKIWSVK